MLDELVGQVLWEVGSWVVGEVVAPALGWIWRAYVRALNVPVFAAVLLDCAAGTGWGVAMLNRGTSAGSIALGFTLLVGCPALALASGIAVWNRLRRERAGEPGELVDAERRIGVVPGLRLRTVHPPRAGDGALPPESGIHAPLPDTGASWQWSHRQEVVPARAREVRRPLS
jgi:hypothetical protein